MKTILQINASLNGASGESTRLAGELVAQLRGRNPDAALIVRDLAREPVPHLDAARFAAFVAKPGERDARQQSVVEYSDVLVDELRRADTIVLALPMYNFGVPSPLKAWMDHVARAGVTFRYTENGPLGLLDGRRVYVVATRGGRYAGTDADTEAPFVRQFFAFLGMTDVEFVYAEGLATGEADRSASLEQARAAIRRAGAPLALAA